MWTPKIPIGVFTSFNFGGTFYIFLRGVDRERGNEYGIFYDKPAVDLIGDLREALIDIGWNLKWEKEGGMVYIRWYHRIQITE